MVPIFKFKSSITKFMCKDFHVTCAPPNINAPALLLSPSGIQAAIKEFNAGKVVPSPKPSKTLIAINAVDPPY